MAFSRHPVTSGIKSIALVLFTANQDFALSGMVGLADDAFLFHALHERGGAVVADLKAALDVARRSLAVARHHLHGLRIEVGAVLAAHGGGVEYRTVLALGILFRR